MRLFGTFKAIEAYLVITGILILLSFNNLCKKQGLSKPFITPISQTQVGSKVHLLPSLDNGTFVNTTLPPSFVADDNGTTLLLDDEHEHHHDTEDMDFLTKTKFNKVYTTTPEPVLTELRETERIRNDSLVSVKTGPAIVGTLNKSNEFEKTLDGVVLPKVDADDTPATPVGKDAVKDLKPPPLAQVVRVEPLPVVSTIAPAAIIATTEAPPAGVLGYISGLFSSNDRNRRDVKEEKIIAIPAWVEHRAVLGQTAAGFFRCEQATSFALKKLWIEEEAYQSIFTVRYFAVGALLVHLLIICYHSLVNITHRVPTSQRLNRLFAGIGLAIWCIIAFWIAFVNFNWGNHFKDAPFVPAFPDELVTFLMLGLAMFCLLVYELLTPMTIFVSYEVSPRHPRMGYVPAAQSENEYIGGIIRQLENSHMEPPYPIDAQTGGAVFKV